jgi:hypothetical protein
MWPWVLAFASSIYMWPWVLASWGKSDISHTLEFLGGKKFKSKKMRYIKQYQKI